MKSIIKTASLCLLCFVLYIVKAIQISNGERELSSMLCCIVFIILMAISGLYLVTLIDEKSTEQSGNSDSAQM
jgi:hypothetical protein